MKTMAEPLAPTSSDVSIVITTYNHAHFLSEAIESAVNQSTAPREIMVVDDGSSDNPAAIVAKYPDVRFVRQSNQGLSTARNTGLDLAVGRYVVFLDADDRLLP